MAAVKSPPYEAYAAILGVFAGSLGVAGAAARLLDRNLACKTPLDLAVLAAAAAIGSTQILAPRFGRLLTWSLAAAWIKDRLEAGFASAARPAFENGRA